MRARTLLILCALLALPLAPTALSHDGPSIEVVAPPSEECPSGKSLCLELASQPTGITPGTQVDLVFYNDDSNSHTIMVTGASNADSSNADTPKSQALASTPSVDPMESSTENVFTVPDGESSLYIWCDVAGHESSGMWLEVPIEGGETENGSPMPAWAAIAGLALAGLTMTVRGRKR